MEWEPKTVHWLFTLGFKGGGTFLSFDDYWLLSKVFRSSFFVRQTTCVLWTVIVMTEKYSLTIYSGFFCMSMELLRGKRTWKRTFSHSYLMIVNGCVAHWQTCCSRLQHCIWVHGEVFLDQFELKLEWYCITIICGKGQYVGTNL